MAEDDIHCDTGIKADVRFQDGGLRHVRGACCYQVARASKNAQLSPDGRGNTYNHAAMLTYFHGSFLYEYLSSPESEHEPPSFVLLTRSKDGIHWEKPREAFPPIMVDGAYYSGPKAECIHTKKVPCIVHHRMGFYTASNGRLLMLTFYGVSPDFHQAPNNGYGVGRVVREVRPDTSMSDIFFLRYNEAGGYNQANTDNFPYFEQSRDAAFKEACRELLHARIVTEQWWEEERLDKDFFARPNGQALSYYTLPTGRVMGVFKNSLSSYTDDGGRSWSPIKKSLSIETSTGKVWGQKTADGRYLLAYNPTPDSAHRWPLAVRTSSDGVHFEGLSAVVPEISPCRYEGRMKNLGAQYIRGITEANMHPSDAAAWLAYSINKEDMWIARVPVPLTDVEAGDVACDFATATEEALRNNWNLYVPAWNSAELEEDASGHRVLRLTDTDPCDRTRAMRLFRPGCMVEISTKVMVAAIGPSPAAIVIEDGSGARLGRILFYPDGRLCVNNIGFDSLLCTYQLQRPIDIAIRLDCVENRMEVCVTIGGSEASLKTNTAASTKGAERVLFATKEDLPWQGLAANGKLGNIGNLPDADKKTARTALDILELNTRTLEE